MGKWVSKTMYETSEGLDVQYHADVESRNDRYTNSEYF